MVLGRGETAYYLGPSVPVHDETVQKVVPSGMGPWGSVRTGSESDPEPVPVSTLAWTTKTPPYKKNDKMRIQDSNQ
jgi:hypothetical protein